MQMTIHEGNEDLLCFCIDLVVNMLLYVYCFIGFYMAYSNATVKCKHLYHEELDILLEKNS